MGFGEDLRGELFGKLGVDQENDPLKLIEQGKIAKESGNNQGAKKAFEQAIEITKTQVEKYSSQNQHRAAAEALYIQALSLGYLNRKDEQREIYIQVVDQLLDAAKNAMAFGENNRGIAQATLAGMVALLYDDQDRAYSIYNDHLGIAEQKENAGYLQKLLYSLGYLLDALKNDNMGALTDAQNYISTDLRPMLSTAKLSGFDTLLENALKHTQDVLQSKIKMPKLHVGTSLPRDIQFNQLFDFDLTVENEGDGQASSLVLNMDIPEDIEVVDGQTNEQVDMLDPEQEINRKFQLRFLTGDTSGEQTRQIKGNVVYYDMLGNSHKQYFGPIELAFTAVSKKEEYQQQLKQILKPIADITPDDLHGSILPGFFEMLQEKSAKLAESIRSKIDEEAFDQVEFGLTHLETAVEQVKSLTSQNELTEKLEIQVSELVDKVKLDFEQELKEQLEQEKQQALDQLKEDKEKELSDKIEQLKTDLNEQHTNEMNDLRDKNQEEMQTQQRDHETKVNQAITNHDKKLREEFNKEKISLKDEHEKEIQSLKSMHQEELSQIKNNIREEVTEKYEQKIKNLEQSLEDLKNQLRNQYEEDKQKELEDQRQKLEMEKEEAVNQKENEITERLKQNYEEELSKKDAEIDQLKRDNNS